MPADASLLSVMLSVAPTVVIGVVGFLLRRLVDDLGRQIGELRVEMREVREALGVTTLSTARLEIRIAELERERDHTRRELRDVRELVDRVRGTA